MMIDAIDQLLNQLLTSQVSLTLARILLCSYYLFAGVLAIKMWDGFVAGMPAKSLGAKKILNVAVIITNFGGSFLLISNIRGLAWLGAGWLGIFTLLRARFRSLLSVAIPCGTSCEHADRRDQRPCC
jgi:transmembrane protein